MQPGYESGRPRMPGFFEGAPVTKWLIILNVGIFLLQILLTGRGEQLFMQSWGDTSIRDTFMKLQLWRLITSQFLHADFGHLLFNCLGLLFFAPHVERWMTSRPYLVFYLLAGIFGNLVYTVLFFVPGLFENHSLSSPAIGASCGILGILAVFYFIAPNATVLLFLIIPVPIRTMAIVFLVYESCIVVFDLHNSGGSAGHLGGALFGYLFFKWPPLKPFVVKLAQIGEKGPKKKRRTRDATIVRESKRSPLEMTKEVDRILDKISEQGIQSLTKKEKETLDKARRK
jgi:membrane associated rhomboid family serine protease